MNIKFALETALLAKERLHMAGEYTDIVLELSGSRFLLLGPDGYIYASFDALWGPQDLRVWAEENDVEAVEGPARGTRWF